MIIIVLILLCSFLQAADLNSLVLRTDTVYKEGFQDACMLNKEIAESAMIYWGSKYNFNTTEYGFYSETDFYPSPLGVFDFELENNQEFYSRWPFLLSTLEKKNINRYVFLLNFDTSHAFSLWYCHEDNKRVLCCFDPIYNMISFSSKIFSGLNLPVYYLGKSIQSDGYSCYLIACLFARFFLAKDNFGKYDASNIISFFERFSKKSFISNGAYEIKKMPEELLMGCQKQNAYQKLSTSIVLTNIAEVFYKNKRRDLLVEGKDGSLLNEYYKKKGLFVFYIIFPVVQFYQSERPACSLVSLLKAAKEYLHASKGSLTSDVLCDLAHQLLDEDVVIPTFSIVHSIKK